MYITRVRVHDGLRNHVDLWDRDLAERVASALEEPGSAPITGLTRYRAIRAPFFPRKALIQQRKSAGIEETVGLANDRALADDVAAVLNRLDPARILPARRIRWYWF
jgi:hypothetical protein